MPILYLGLGILIGLIIAALLIAIDLAFKKKVDHRGIVGHVMRRAEGRAEIIMPPSEEAETLLESFNSYGDTDNADARLD